MVVYCSFVIRLVSKKTTYGKNADEMTGTGGQRKVFCANENLACTQTWPRTPRCPKGAEHALFQSAVTFSPVKFDTKLTFFALNFSTGYCRAIKAKTCVKTKSLHNKYFKIV